MKKVFGNGVEAAVDDIAVAEEGEVVKFFLAIRRVADSCRRVACEFRCPIGAGRDSVFGTDY